MRPLDGVTVVDFSQFLAGPYAALRLLDLGARVIKVENPDRGDLCRHHYVSATRVEGDSTLFHAINRGKESLTLDLKSIDGQQAAQRLVAGADVVIQNFRPGVIDRLGLGYEAAQALRPGLVYGSISGYGETGDWAGLPGQDLLAQARSGLMWLSGDRGQGPVPVGLPVADIAAGACLAQGLLAALFRQARSGVGAHVQTSLLEALIDLQFEFLTTWMSNGQTPPRRMRQGSAHGYLAAPYGVYDTAEGWLALAMTPLPVLTEALGRPALTAELDGMDGFADREAIRAAVQAVFATGRAADWEAELAAKGIWCARVRTWEDMIAEGGPAVTGMLRPGAELARVAAPFRLDGQRPEPARRGPALNEHGQKLAAEFGFSAAAATG
ncbi:MAG: CaiB/BaiF CoA-transferase family protein [Marinovum algicola]|uniref:Crotonobetainyl-CoA:carnitine CoA-transferase CaiB n=1 Tax=Marinovum algicola TaxID=42444 RepID=A0A975ZLI6_9RHOB|nr:CaiB/BaiF CoA-transferase family protein [Marinovum algicola]SEI59070.1 Crotonobetainyl-CoA:carnitine CoA-transferase CaiB [Marinovum algicola]SLN27262.1 Formyl-coenzyme A transferase [Marinovum algicola]